jgi:hypothetical protein
MKRRYRTTSGNTLTLYEFLLARVGLRQKHENPNMCYLIYMLDGVIGLNGGAPLTMYFLVRRWAYEMPSRRQWWIIRLSDGVVLAQNRVEELGR